MLGHSRPNDLPRFTATKTAFKALGTRFTDRGSCFCAPHQHDGSPGGHGTVAERDRGEGFYDNLLKRETVIIFYIMKGLYILLNKLAISKIRKQHLPRIPPLPVGHCQQRPGCRRRRFSPRHVRCGRGARRSVAHVQSERWKSLPMDGKAWERRWWPNTNVDALKAVNHVCLKMVKIVNVTLWIFYHNKENFL